MCSLYVQPLVNHTHWLECVGVNVMLVTSMQTIIPILPCHKGSRRLRATIEFWYYCLVIWISVEKLGFEFLKPRNLLTYNFLKVSRFFSECFSFFLFSSAIVFKARFALDWIWIIIIFWLIWNRNPKLKISSIVWVPSGSLNRPPSLSSDCHSFESRFVELFVARYFCRMIHSNVCQRSLENVCC